MCKSIQEQFGNNCIRNLILLDSTPIIMKELSKEMLIKIDIFDENYAFVKALIIIINFVKIVEISENFVNDLLSAQSSKQKCSRIPIKCNG